MKTSREIELLVKRADDAVWNYKQISICTNSKPGKAYLLKKPFFDMLKTKLKNNHNN